MDIKIWSVAERKDAAQKGTAKLDSYQQMMPNPRHESSNTVQVQILPLQNFMNSYIGKICFYKNRGCWKRYVVTGWFMDANGVLKTYGSGYEESFIDLSVYFD